MSKEEIQRSLGVIEGKVGEVLTRLDRISEHLHKHDNEILNLNCSVSNISGKATVWGLIAGTSVTVLWTIIKDKIFGEIK